MKGIIFGLLVVGMIGPIYAQSFESIDDENYLFLNIEDNTATGVFRIDGKIVTFQNEIKFYDEDTFKFRVSSDRLLFFGNQEQVTIIDLNERKYFVINIQKVSDVSFEVDEQEHIGMPHIETIKNQEAQKQKEIEESQRLEELENKNPRSEYTLSEIEEIVILGNMPDRFPYHESMDFGVRVVDTERNPFVKWQSYWDDNMGIDDVEIEAIVKDPDGITIKKMSGLTEDKGRFLSEKTFFSQHYKKGQYSIIVDAVQYFDDLETFAKSSLVSYFSLYTSSDSNSIDTYPPVGTILIESTDGITDSTTPDIALTCNDYGIGNVLVDGGCSKMAFFVDNATFANVMGFEQSTIIIPNVNSTHFLNVPEYDYADNFTLPMEFENNTLYHVFVQFTDDSGRDNKSVDVILDSVFVILK